MKFYDFSRLDAIFRCFDNVYKLVEEDFVALVISFNVVVLSLGTDDYRSKCGRLFLSLC